MLTVPRLGLYGLTLGLLLAAGLPASAQSGRAVSPVEPFQATGTGNAIPGAESQEFELNPPVPAGKLFVVEGVYGQVLVNTGQATEITLGQGGRRVPIATALQSSFGGIDNYLPLPGVRLYLPAGVVSARIATTPGSTAAWIATVVGHLVPAPPAP